MAVVLHTSYTKRCATEEPPPPARRLRWAAAARGHACRQQQKCHALNKILPTCGCHRRRPVGRDNGDERTRREEGTICAERHMNLRSPHYAAHPLRGTAAGRSPLTVAAQPCREFSRRARGLHEPGITPAPLSVPRHANPLARQAGALLGSTHERSPHPLRHPLGHRHRVAVLARSRRRNEHQRRPRRSCPTRHTRPRSPAPRRARRPPHGDRDSGLRRMAMPRLPTGRTPGLPPARHRHRPAGSGRTTIHRPGRATRRRHGPGSQRTGTPHVGYGWLPSRGPLAALGQAAVSRAGRMFAGCQDATAGAVTSTASPSTPATAARASPCWTRPSSASLWTKPPTA